MKKLITFFLFLPFLSFAQFSLLGKWQNTEFHGNNGATGYVSKFENGRTYLFERDGTVKDQMDRVGTYQLENDILKISFPELAMQSLKEETVLYQIFYQDAKPNTASFIPMNDKHQSICIEPCAETFERIIFDKNLYRLEKKVLQKIICPAETIEVEGRNYKLIYKEKNGNPPSFDEIKKPFSIDVGYSCIQYGSDYIVISIFRNTGMINSVSYYYEAIEYDLKIKNANILDIKSGKILTNKTILILKEKIANISDSANHKSTKTINAKGKLVTPGFIDPHIHPTDVFGDYEKAPRTLPKDSLEFLRKKLSDEYLPFGTTTVMTMGQPETWLEDLLKWQKNPNSDNVDFIVCGGALISKDNRTPYIAHTELTSPKLAMQKMLEYYDLGIRHVKLYHRLKEPEFSSVIKMADSLNIKTYGHIGDFSPEYLTINQTLEKGLKNYEHLALIPNSLITSDEDWAKLDKQFKENFGELNTESKVIEFFLEQFRYIKENKEREMQVFIQKLIQNKATFSTTLHRLYEQFETTYFTQIKDKTLTKKQVKRCKENFAIMMKYVKQMHDLGIEIRLGSDMPNGGKVNLSELIILSKYGFTTAEIFKIASYNGAKAIGIENQVGNIEQGLKANLIIWSKNPFINPKNFVSEKIIIKNGIQLQ